jgi:hypothetical protein
MDDRASVLPNRDPLCTAVVATHSPQSPGAQPQRAALGLFTVVQPTRGHLHSDSPTREPTGQLERGLSPLTIDSEGDTRARGRNFCSTQFGFHLLDDERCSIFEPSKG